MKLILLISLIFLIHSSVQETLISGNEACVSCIGKGKKACRSSSDSVDLYCCKLSENSANCGLGTDSICSNTLDMNNNPGSEYLVCPNNNNCGLDYYDSYQDFITSISASYVPQDGTCIFRLTNRGENTNSIRFNNTVLTNVEAHVYSKNDYDYFYYIGDFLHQYQFAAVKDEDLFLIVFPDSSDDGEFGTEITSIADSDNAFPLEAIVGIIFGCILLVAFFFTTIYCCIKRGKIRTATRALEQNNTNLIQDIYPQQRQAHEYESTQVNHVQPISFSPALNASQANIPQHPGTVYSAEQVPAQADGNSYYQSPQNTLGNIVQSTATQTQNSSGDGYRTENQPLLQANDGMNMLKTRNLAYPTIGDTIK